MAEESGVRFPVEVRLFFVSFRPVLGPSQPTVQWVPAAVSLRVKRPGCDANHSLPFSIDAAMNTYMCCGHSSQGLTAVRENPVIFCLLFISGSRTSWSTNMKQNTKLVIFANTLAAFSRVRRMRR